ncbi:sigma-70 family RNA polymerase sigma factor [Sneathiella sp. P13V-1]|uniref:sigma-70 family RNA polymerase sigma factor n=1 Tax=Sneathiella sp. P13V-1 TaxID=2697366 RepID=UPI00187BBF4E|nr:sigma-70 family RNA polymerase sigma factor [Sneathiella sp. P13V-1]MBE7636617.1 sigma-70 family RNA polymerase sigma factor [Sneathiella sp. P13V-1]
MQRLNNLMDEPETIDDQPLTAQELDQLLGQVAESSDQASFRKLFDAIAPRLKSFLRTQTRDDGEIEVILQETMLKVWRRAETFDRNKSSAVTWIYTVARNVKIDRLRKMSRPEPDPNDPSFIPAPVEDAEQMVNRQQQGDLLRKAVSILPEGQKEIIMLAFFEEKPHSEIAEILGVPLGTVKSRIRLAFGKIRNELERLK